MENIRTWAKRWGIPPQALQELYGIGGDDVPTSAPAGMSETALTQRVRLEATRRGQRLWRNNNGACVDDKGRHIRYGLANDSHQLNDRLKSSDLIGVTPHVVTPEDVGNTHGIITCYECKRPGWKYSNTAREQAQLAWLVLITRMGGIAKFVQGVEDL